MALPPPTNLLPFFLLFLIPIFAFLYKSSFPSSSSHPKSNSNFNFQLWLLPLFSQPLSRFLYSSPLSSFPPLVLISTNQLTLLGEMAAPRFSTMATFLLFPSIRPPALASSPEMSICTAKSICKSSSFLATLPALSLPTT